MPRNEQHQNARVHRSSWKNAITFLMCELKKAFSLRSFSLYIYEILTRTMEILKLVDIQSKLLAVVCRLKFSAPKSFLGFLYALHTLCLRARECVFVHEFRMKFDGVLYVFYW